MVLIGTGLSPPTLGWSVTMPASVTPGSHCTDRFAGDLYGDEVFERCLSAGLTGDADGTGPPNRWLDAVAGL